MHRAVQYGIVEYNMSSSLTTVCLRMHHEYTKPSFFLSLSECACHQVPVDSLHCLWWFINTGNLKSIFTLLSGTQGLGNHSTSTLSIAVMTAWVSALCSSLRLSLVPMEINLNINVCSPLCVQAKRQGFFHLIFYCLIQSKNIAYQMWIWITGGH